MGARRALTVTNDEQPRKDPERLDADEPARQVGEEGDRRGEARDQHRFARVTENVPHPVRDRAVLVMRALAPEVCEHKDVVGSDAHDDEERQPAEEGEEAEAEAVLRRPSVAVDEVRLKEGRKDLENSARRDEARAELVHHVAPHEEHAEENEREVFHRVELAVAAEREGELVRGFRVHLLEPGQHAVFNRRVQALRLLRAILVRVVQVLARGDERGQVALLVVVHI